MRAPETTTLPDELRAALRDRLEGVPPRQAARAVERLMTAYRGDTPAEPVLREPADVTAYAAYRMPATFEAVRAALRAFRAAAGDWTPRTHLDVGGGTGAASWAVADAWPAATYTTQVLDRAQPALDLGRDLVRNASHPALRSADWRRLELAGGPAPSDAAPFAVPFDADLVTVSYLLAELPAAEREALIAAAGRSARAVVVVEPGTPAGYARVLEARRRLIDAGLTVLAPCPHGADCPIGGTDWCHFAARVSRSALHRQVKGGSLPYEDEKFSYLAALRAPAGAPAGGPAAARIVRRPQLRKGQVLLDLCQADGTLERVTVSKRHGPLYRAARDARWGDSWPPPQAD